MLNPVATKTGTATVCSEAEDGGTYLFFMHPGFLRPASVKVRSAKDFLPNTDVIEKMITSSFNHSRSHIMQVD